MPTIDSATRLQLAIEELAKNPGISQREIARLYGVPQSTLQARLKGRRAAKHYHQAAQRLSVHEEQALIDWIERMTSWGWPPRIQHLEGMARSLLNAKGDKNPLGRHWYQKFLKRHPDFKIKYSRNLDQSRKDAGSPEILRDWFELYTTTLVKYGISDEDTYNMDEKGFAMGIADSSKVIIKGTTTPFNVHPEIGTGFLLLSAYHPAEQFFRLISFSKVPKFNLHGMMPWRRRQIPFGSVPMVGRMRR